MHIVDDEQLLKLSAQPSVQLWPLLDRARSFNPLVVLLVVLPTMFAWYSGALTEQDASWGLHVLRLSRVESLTEMLDTTAVDPNSQWNWFPPLGVWLQALQFRWSNPVTGTLFNWLPPVFTITLITLCFFFVRKMTSPRFAFWFVVLLSFQGEVTRQAQSPLPVALAVLLAVLALWGVLLHVATQNSWLSIHLVWGGICLGLCLLTGGPVALLVLLVSAVALFAVPQVKPKSKRVEQSVKQHLREKVLSLTVLGSLAWLAGGWWLGWMSLRSQNGFLLTWLLGAEPVSVLFPGDESLLTGNVLVDFLLLMNGLTGFLLIGILQSVKVIVREDEHKREPWLLFLLIWFVIALLGWIGISLLSESSARFLVTTTKLFLVLPSLILCTFALEEIARRHVSGPLVMGTCLVMLGGMNLFYTRQLPWNLSLTFLTAPTFFVLVMLAYWGRTYRREGHSGLPLLLSSLVLCTIFTHVSTSFLYGLKPSEDNRHLKQIHTELKKQQDVQAVTLITRRQVPARLRFLSQSLWPDAKVTVHSNWDSVLTINEKSGKPQTQKELTDQIFIAWNLRDPEPAGLNLLGVELESAATPKYLSGAPLLTFRLKRTRFTP